MSFQVQIPETGESFVAKAGETVLAAALRADAVDLLQVLACYQPEEPIPAAVLPGAASGSLQARLQHALFGADWPTSLRANLQRLQWAAGSVRGKLSQANWQALVELQREAQLLEGQPADFGELLDFLNRLLMSLAALSGFARTQPTANAANVGSDSATVAYSGIAA